MHPCMHACMYVCMYVSMYVFIHKIEGNEWEQKTTGKHGIRPTKLINSYLRITTKPFAIEFSEFTHGIPVSLDAFQVF